MPGPLHRQIYPINKRGKPIQFRTRDEPQNGIKWASCQTGFSQRQLNFLNYDPNSLDYKAKQFSRKFIKPVVYVGSAVAGVAFIGVALATSGAVGTVAIAAEAAALAATPSPLAAAGLSASQVGALAPLVAVLDKNKGKRGSGITSLPKVHANFSTIKRPTYAAFNKSCNQKSKEKF